MATQTVEFRAETAQTLTVKRFTVGNDTVLDTTNATEETNRKGTYRVAYTDATPGEYQLIVFNGDAVIANWHVYLFAATATYQTYDRHPLIAEIWQRLGLDPNSPLVNTNENISAATNFNLAVTKTPIATTLTRQ